jgi:hypothetical protein
VDQEILMNAVGTSDGQTATKDGVDVAREAQLGFLATAARDLESPAMLRIFVRDSEIPENDGTPDNVAYSRQTPGVASAGPDFVERLDGHFQDQIIMRSGVQDKSIPMQCSAMGCKYIIKETYLAWASARGRRRWVRAQADTAPAYSSRR